MTPPHNAGANGRSPIELADEPDFALGGAVVSPSVRSFIAAGEEQRLEPRVMQVLVALAKANGATVSRDALIQSCWDGLVVGDDAVNRVIARLRKIAADNGDSYRIETISRVGFRLIAADPSPETPAPRSLPRSDQALPRSAAPDFAIDGIHLSPSQDEARAADFIEAGRDVEAQSPGAATASMGRLWPPRLPARRRLSPIIGALVILFAAFSIFAFARVRQNDGVRVPDKVIVAAFVSVDADRQTERIAGALTEAALRRMQGFAIGDIAGATASRRRGIKYRISGSVARDIDQIVVVSQIFERRSNIILWSEKFEQPIEEAGGIEERVAIALSAILKCAFDEQARNHGDIPPEAFSLLLQVCDALIIFSHDPLEAARALHDAFPKIAGAKSLLALAAARRAIWMEVTPLEHERLLEIVRQRAGEALKADPRDATALTALAFVETQRTEKERLLQNALEIDPDLALVHYVRMLREVGRLKEALRTGERLLWMTDPRARAALPHIAFMAAILGEEAIADEAIRKFDEFHPGMAAGMRWTIAIWWIDPTEAARQLPQLTQDLKDKSNTACFDIVIPAIAAGKPSSQLPSECDGLDPHWKVRMLARIGDIDGAYDLLSTIDRDHLLTQILFYPEMRVFRHDERFIALAGDLGFIDYWRQDNAWPDFCDEPDLPYNCRQEAAKIAIRSSHNADRP